MGNQSCPCLNSMTHSDKIGTILANNTTMIAAKATQRNFRADDNSNLSTIVETPAIMPLTDEHTQYIANRITDLNLILENQSINLELSRQSLIQDTRSVDSSILVEDDPVFEDLSFEEDLNFKPAKMPGEMSNAENA